MEEEDERLRIETPTMKMFHQLMAIHPEKSSKPKKIVQGRLSNPQKIKKTQRTIKQERLIAEMGRQKREKIKREVKLDNFIVMLKTVGQAQSSGPKQIKPENLIARMGREQVKLENLITKMSRERPRAVQKERSSRPQKAKMEKPVFEIATEKPQIIGKGLSSPLQVKQELSLEIAREMAQIMEQKRLPSPPLYLERSIAALARIKHQTIEQERLSRNQHIKPEKVTVEMAQEKAKTIKKERSPGSLDLDRSLAVLASMKHQKIEVDNLLSMTQKLITQMAREKSQVDKQERLSSPPKITVKLRVDVARENTQLIKQESLLNPLENSIVKMAAKKPRTDRLERLSSPQKIGMDIFIPQMARERPQTIKHMRFLSPQQIKMGKLITRTEEERPQKIEQERLLNPQKSKPDKLIFEMAREKLQKIKQEWYSKPQRGKVVKFVDTTSMEKPTTAKHMGLTGNQKVKKEKSIIEIVREEHQTVNQKKPSNPPKINPEKLILQMDSEKPVRYTSQQLNVATDNYSQPLGSGGFGVVYRGEFAVGLIVAVKVLKEGSDKRMEEQFVAELNSIGRIHHYNLVKLYGFCFEDKMRALVYEFMEKGSLDNLLFHQERAIEWEKLYDIAIGTAKAIAYLHEDCRERIIHYDIKPENILLDQNFSPKVADFGLSRLYNRDNTHVTPTCFKGTLGYAAPELFMPFWVTCKCDVYSFGMVLFEIVGRKRNSNWGNSKSIEEWFPVYVWKKFEEGTVGQMLEGLGIEEKYRKKAERMIIVALWCAQYQPEIRPRMSNVVKMLEGEVTINEPKNPFPQLLCG